MRSLKTAFLIPVCTLFCLLLTAQKDNWQNLDLQKDSVFGISTERVYSELILPAVKHPLVVAVIDSGIDTTHEDLKAILWTNPKEEMINGRDDDHNGYKDDYHGWDFIGGPTGNVRYDNLELTRVLREMKTAHDTMGAFPSMLKKYDQEKKEAKKNLDGLEGFAKKVNAVLTALANENPGLAELQAYQPPGPNEEQVKNVLLYQLSQGNNVASFMKDQVGSGIEHYKTSLEYQLNEAFDPRGIVGDDYTKSKERKYGNADVMGPDALHGTHVAGIIAALRDNGVGIKGVADQVQIMAIRAVPDGDERDKDIANSIRYAVDNGAKVINMSFGKAYSHDKAIIDKAVKYAMKKDVLLVLAAGNEDKDLDKETGYPNPDYADGSGTAAGWITVGATAATDDSTLVAEFSNYGKTKVDVFAPGVQIYSSVPGSRYVYESGTSMAAPVVSGLAALIRSHYPKLSAVQVKEIIMLSSVKPSHTIMVKENNQTKKLLLSDICVSGGVVNAFNAMQLAATY